MLRPLIPSIRRLVSPNQPERNIKVPMMSITGSQDGCISTQKKLDGSRFMQAPFQHLEVQAGHFMHLELPSEVNQAISGWIQAN